MEEECRIVEEEEIRLWVKIQDFYDWNHVK